MQANSSVEYFHIFPLLQVEKADILGLRKKKKILRAILC